MVAPACPLGRDDRPQRTRAICLGRSSVRGGGRKGVDKGRSIKFKGGNGGQG